MSAKKRMLASKRADVGSMRVSMTGEVAGGVGSVRSAIGYNPKQERYNRHTGACKPLLHFLINPLLQTAAVFFQQKTPHADAISENLVRLGITGSARNPLLAYSVLG